MNVSEILNKAADLIEPEGAWTKASFARDEQGNQVSPTSMDAKCWCIYGALDRIAADFDEFDMAYTAERFLHDTLPCSILMFNDDRTQSEVVTALREAAKRAAND